MYLRFAIARQHQLAPRIVFEAIERAIERADFLLAPIKKRPQLLELPAKCGDALILESTYIDQLGVDNPSVGQSAFGPGKIS